MKSVIQYFYQGQKDGYENRPKVRGLNPDQKKAYENGYAEGHQDRSREGADRKKKKLK